jgi:hypothetical protein
MSDNTLQSRRLVGWLAAVEGPLAGADFKLFDGVNVIGRDPGQVQILTNDPTISRVHAQIEISRRPDGWRAVIKNRSQNGTILEDQLVNEAELMDRDRLVMGMSVFAFVLLHGPRARHPAPGSAPGSAAGPAPGSAAEKTQAPGVNAAAAAALEAEAGDLRRKVEERERSVRILREQLAAADKLLRRLEQRLAVGAEA